MFAEALFVSSEREKTGRSAVMWRSICLWRIEQLLRYYFIPVLFGLFMMTISKPPPPIFLFLRLNIWRKVGKRPRREREIRVFYLLFWLARDVSWPSFFFPCILFFSCFFGLFSFRMGFMCYQITCRRKGFRGSFSPHTLRQHPASRHLLTAEGFPSSQYLIGSWESLSVPFPTLICRSYYYISGFPFTIVLEITVTSLAHFYQRTWQITRLKVKRRKLVQFSQKRNVRSRNVLNIQ